MHLQYQPACIVFFHHPFFTTGKLRTITVQPSADTSLAMRGHGFAFKPFDSGFHLLYESFFAGRERSREEALEQGTLRFVLANNDAVFFHYTPDFGADISQHVFYFTNSTATPVQEGVLHPEIQASKENLVPTNTLGEAFFKKPFGVIDIRMHPHIEKEFSITFPALSTYWRYLLIQEHLQELACPAIIHKDTKQAFLGPETVMLPDGKKARAFCSTDPIVHCEKPGKYYQLVDRCENDKDRYRVIVSSLPGPDLNRISRISPHPQACAGTGISEIFL